MTKGCRQLINVNKVPPAQHSGGSKGGDITGLDDTAGFWGHFLSLNLDFLNVLFKISYFQYKAQE